MLLNFGVSEANWWFHYEFAPLCSRTVLVAYDKLALWSAMAPRRPLLERVRARLVAGSDVVCGLSQGSIDDVPGATYVGHGVDDGWHEAGVDAAGEPADLAPIPHPRAVYVGAMSMRFDLEAVADLAAAGIHVVLIGLAPPPQLLDARRGRPLRPLPGRARAGAHARPTCATATSESCPTPTSRSPARWSRTRPTTTRRQGCRR